MLLVISIVCLLILTLGFIYIFSRKKTCISFYLPTVFLIVSSAGLYLVTGQWASYLNWKNAGAEHYALLVQVESMGGINEIIHQLERKLALNSGDVNGWLILAKLYLGTNQKEKSQEALIKAYALAPRGSK